MFCHKKYYDENREKLRSVANRNTAKRRERNQQWLINFMHGKKCGCGVSDLRVLTFDHIDPSNKRYNVADIVSKGMKLEYLVEEVEKCQILCHNCHMLNTFKQIGGSYHDKMMPITEEEFTERYNV